MTCSAGTALVAGCHAARSLGVRFAIRRASPFIVARLRQSGLYDTLTADGEALNPAFVYRHESWRIQARGQRALRERPRENQWRGRRPRGKMLASESVQSQLAVHQIGRAHV